VSQFNFQQETEDLSEEVSNLEGEILSLREYIGQLETENQLLRARLEDEARRVQQQKGTW
jgi:predicted  nucleic acid-binding Zn-ribbon protein